MATTFAEAGEQETALDIMAEASKEIRGLLQESEAAGVRCHFSIKPGNPEKEIVSYVNDHRNVVLTIYDVFDQDANEADNNSKKKKSLTRIRKSLSVPLVTVQI